MDCRLWAHILHLVVVHDVDAAATDLVVLDARTLAATAELRVDRLLPLGLHGTWA